MQTLADFIQATRILLKDTMVGAYRYDDDMLKLALSFAFDEAFRIRPDMFVSSTIPNVMAMVAGDTVPVPNGYKMSFTYYMAGWTQMQDEEDTQDARAAAFMNKFTSQLLATAA